MGGFPYSREDWAWSSAWFAMVGLSVGALGGAVFLLARPLGNTTAALLSVGFLIMATGAFHEDGLADTADALGGGSGREKVFQILKDSRLGSYGVLALVLSIGLRVSLIAGAREPAAAIVAAACLGRVAPVWLMASLPYVTERGSSKSSGVVEGRWKQASFNTAVGLVVLAGLGSVMSWPLGEQLGIVLSLSVVAVLMGSYFQQRVGGITGDFLGAVEQVGEIVVLMWLAWP